MWDLSLQVFFVSFCFCFAGAMMLFPQIGIIRGTEHCSPDNTGLIISLFLDILTLWCLLSIEELEKFVNCKLTSRHGS